MLLGDADAHIVAGHATTHEEHAPILIPCERLTAGDEPLGSYRRSCVQAIDAVSTGPAAWKPGAMSDEQWYFDRRRGVAVPASERGHADDMLGPYPSKAAAENWREHGRRAATMRGTQRTTAGSTRARRTTSNLRGVARPIQIVPSVLPADFARLGDEVAALEKAGVDSIQWDVMDGQFVPNLTFGPDVIKAARPHCTVPFEAHLMVYTPDVLAERFVEAGCSRLIVHAEACTHLHRTLGNIASMGAVGRGRAQSRHTGVGRRARARPRRSRARDDRQPRVRGAAIHRHHGTQDR